jgi:uncharacterized protein with GYD domain
VDHTDFAKIRSEIPLSEISELVKGDGVMTTFVILLRWTEKGVEHIRESPNRVEQFSQVVKKAGGEVTSFHMTLGAYDLMTVIEVPDDETGANVSLSLRSLGNVKVETLRAFNEDEFRKIIAALP